MRAGRSQHDDDVALLALDLTSLDSVRTAAAALRSRLDQFALLINNAGVMNRPQQTTGGGRPAPVDSDAFGQANQAASKLLSIMRRANEPTLTDQASNVRLTMICRSSGCSLATRSPAQESAGQRLSPDGSRELIVRSFGVCPATEINLRLDHVCAARGSDDFAFGCAFRPVEGGSNKGTNLRTLRAEEGKVSRFGPRRDIRFASEEDC